MSVIVRSSSSAIITLRCVFEFAGITYHGACSADVAASASRYADWYASQCLRASRSEMSNFQCLVWSSMRACSRARCSSFEMCRKHLMMVVPF